MSAVLLDRDRELEALNRHLASIKAGAGRVVVVEGPAGIGKSSLLAAVTRAAAANGFITCSARGGPLECDAVWGIARQIFEPVRRREDWAELTTGAAALAGPALALATPEPAPGGDAMHAAVHGLVWLASNLAERQPVLLVIDDAHWADASSLRWLATLSRRLSEVPIGVLCAVRSGEPSPSADLLAELLAAAPDPTVRPRPLGLAAVEDIVVGALPGAEQVFVEACHAVSAGNPFLLGVLVAQVRAEGMTPSQASAARLDQVEADQVTRSVVRQLGRLPTGADRLAGALAVLGRDASLRHAAELAGCSLPEAAALADAMRAAGLLRGEHDLTLAHPLIASSLYAHLGHGARALLHQRAADLLAAEAAEPERVALHLLHTDARADPAVVRMLRAAASGASARGAPESAAVLLRRALAEPPDRATSAAVHLELGLAQAHRYHPDTHGLLRKAIALAGSSDVRVATALRGARALGQAGSFEEAMDLAVRGLAGADAAQDAAVPGAAEARERLEQELIMDASMQAGTRAEAVRRHRAARPDPLLPGLTAVNAASLQATWAGLPATTVRRLLAPALVRDVFSTEMDSLLSTAAAIILIGIDELDTSIAWSTALIDAARPRGWLLALTQGCLRRSMALVRAGRIRDAEADAPLLLEAIAGNSPPGASTWTLRALVDVLTESDRLDEAESVLRDRGQLAAPPTGALGAPVLLESRARLRLAQGQLRRGLRRHRVGAPALRRAGRAASGPRLLAGDAGRVPRRPGRPAPGRGGGPGAPPARRQAGHARGTGHRQASSRPDRRQCGARAAAPAGDRARGVLARPAGARPLPGGPRGSAAACEPARRRSAPAAPGSRPRRPARDDAAGRTCPRRAARHRCSATAARDHGTGVAHPGGAPRRGPREAGGEQPRHRRPALRHPADGGDAPDARLPEAGHRQPW